jgi:hypothetical protein
VEKTKGEAWFYLDRLALAYSKAGDYSAALTSGERALGLMPPSADRNAVQERLARFRAEARKTARP